MPTNIFEWIFACLGTAIGVSLGCLILYGIWFLILDAWKGDRHRR